jgi:hypothetical protein
LLHERTKVPVAVYIREGIDLVLRQYGHLLPGQLPLAADAPAASSPAPVLAADARPSAPRPERADGASASAPERALGRAAAADETGRGAGPKS